MMTKKAILVYNIFMLVFWLVIAGIVTYFVSKSWLGGISQPWRAFLGGIIFIGVIILISIITNMFKAAKYPDVQAASNLGIPVGRFQQYRDWYDEHQRLMQKYGIDSKEANEYFMSFLRQIKYPNEWRKYQQSRYRSISDILNGK